MSLLATLTSRLALLRDLRPATLKALGTRRLEAALLGELGRARARVAELEKRYPSAAPRELAQHVIQHKQQMASMVGGVSGVFGLASIPADLLAMAWIQLLLLVDLATVYRVNLKSGRARSELLELFGYANGVGPLQRSGPKLLGKLSSAVFRRTGWGTLGRTLPLLASPLTAYLNHRHVQQVGDEALRFYEGFDRAGAKRREQESGPPSPLD